MSRLSLLLLVVVTGCTTHQYDATDYWMELGQTHCQRMVDCCTAAEYNDWWTADSTGDMYSCLQTHQHPQRESQIRDAIDHGRIRFNATAAHACVTALESLACPDFEPAYRYRETYCESPLHGTIADGAACETHEECLSTFCEILSGSRGTCQPRIAEGQPCMTDDACERPMGCQVVATSMTCGIGDAPGASCYSDYDCIDHWCDGGTLLTPGNCRRACDGQ